MPAKYVVNINGAVGAVGRDNVITMVQGDEAEIYIGNNQVIVTRNGLRVYPKPHSEAKMKLWDTLKKAEAILLKWPINAKWLEARKRVDAAWQQYHDME